METDLTEVRGIDLLDEYEKLIAEQARKPKTFSKAERLNIVYEEVFRRIFNYNE